MEAYFKGQPKDFYNYIGYDTKSTGQIMIEHELYDELNEKYELQLSTLNKEIRSKYRKIYEDNQTELQCVFDKYEQERKSKEKVYTPKNYDEVDMSGSLLVAPTFEEEKDE